ncbi:MAG: Rrf2 family transcriptional regulator [Saprospiraceae bacterium]|nr:Rrf2 family transcriptional regulator [Saprospiraceae bacterium]
MVFTKSFSYIIKILIFMAIHSKVPRLFGAKELSEELGIPVAFISKKLRNMVDAGLLNSYKGPNGGFEMNALCYKTPLSEMLKISDHKDYFNTCVLHFNKCNSKKPCPMHHLMGPVNQELKSLLERTTLNDLLNGNHKTLLRQLQQD